MGDTGNLVGRQLCEPQPNEGKTMGLREPVWVSGTEVQSGPYPTGAHGKPCMSKGKHNQLFSFSDWNSGLSSLSRLPSPVSPFEPGQQHWQRCLADPFVPNLLEDCWQLSLLFHHLLFLIILHNPVYLFYLLIFWLGGPWSSFTWLDFCLLQVYPTWNILFLLEKKNK